MGKTDLVVNQLMERKEIFADFINGMVFDGEQVLQPEKMELLSVNSGFIYEEDGKRKFVERRGDIRMKADMDTYSLVIANENQSHVHYAMPVRTMLYDSLEYMKQVREIENEHKKEGKELSGDAYLSHFSKEDRLSPVMTTVFYCNTSGEWDGCQSLHEMLNLDDDSDSGNKVKDLVQDYRINLIQSKDFSKYKNFKTSLQQIFAMLNYNQDKKQLLGYMKEHEEEIARMDDLEKQAAWVLLGEQKRVEQLMAGREGKEELNMCQAIEELIQDGEARGQKLGIERGREQGIALFIAFNQKIGMIKEEAIENLADTYSLSLSKAEQYYEKYAQ